ncbi:hypothetical protein WS76_11785 [Burkholderia humptydooensis]|nr:hypothetical protein WS76_11785 [Burkholderia humptydooensis]
MCWTNDGKSTADRKKRSPMRRPAGETNNHDPVSASIAMPSAVKRWHRANGRSASEACVRG